MKSISTENNSAVERGFGTFRFLLGLFGGVLISLISLAVIEVGLRACGLQPVKFAESKNIMPIVALDPVRGWRLIPSAMDMQHQETSTTVNYRIGWDGGRCVGNCYDLPQLLVSRKPMVALLGDSFTMGYGLHEENTAAYYLQQSLDDVQIINAGVAGYGPVQIAAHFFELAKQQPRLRKAVYLFPGFHEIRAVSPPSHSWRLAITNAARSIWMPYATIGSAGELVIHAPETFNLKAKWLAEHTVLATHAYDLLFALQSSERLKMKREVTTKLIDQMIGTAHVFGIELSILLIGHTRESSDFYREMLASKGVRVIEADSELVADSDLAFDLSHPGPIHQRYWGELIGSALAEGGYGELK
jgi:hypothetical protein